MKPRQVSLCVILAMCLVFVSGRATAQADSSSLIISLENAAQLQPLASFEGNIVSSEPMIANNGIVTAVSEDQISLFDAVTGETLTLPKPGDFGQSLAASPDGQFIVYHANVEPYGTILDNLKTNQQIPLINEPRLPNGPDIVNFNVDGKRLLIEDSSNRISHQWDLQTGKEIIYDAALGITLQQAFYSPDGSKILSFGEDTLTVLDTISGKTLLTIPDTKSDSKAQFFPNSQILVVYTRSFGETKSRLELWDVVSGQKLSSIPLDPKTAWSKEHFQISPDGQSISFSDRYTNEVQIWELPDLRNPGPQHIYPNGLSIKRGRTGVYTNTGHTLAVSLDNLFELTDIATGKKFRASVADTITNLAVVDGDKLVIVAEFNSISNREQISLWSWDGVKAEKLRTLAGSYFHLSADGTTLYTYFALLDPKFYRYLQLSLAYGLPSAERSQRPYRMMAVVAPQSINVRSEPNTDAPISGTASGVVWMLGRDASGKYVYLPDYHGWVLADATYLTLPQGFTVDQLVILDPAAIPTQG